MKREAVSQKIQNDDSERNIFLHFKCSLLMMNLKEWLFSFFLFFFFFFFLIFSALNMLPRDLVYYPVCGFGVGTVTQQFVSFSIKKDTYFMWYVIFLSSLFPGGETLLACKN